MKNHWSRFGKAFWLQLAPFVAVLVIIAVAMTISLSRLEDSETVAFVPSDAKTMISKQLVALPSGPNTPLPTYVTVRDKVPLRAAPNSDAPILVSINKNTTVTMTAIIPRERWVQIRLHTGKTGFVLLDDLH